MREAGVSQMRCVACGAEGVLFYEGLRDVRFGLEGVFSMRRCRRCDLLWLDPLPELFPEEKYSYPASCAGETAHRPLDGLRQRVRRMILCGFYGYDMPGRTRADIFWGKTLGLLPWLRQRATWDLGALLPPAPERPGALAVDVGCGEGNYLAIVKSLGWRVRGIEPQPQGAAAARRRGIDVFEGIPAEAKIEDGSADWVTLIHVLEHTPDPAGILGTVFRWLRPGARLALRVPNVLSLGHRRFGRRWYLLDPPRHLFGFAPKSLRLLLSRFAFKRIQVRILTKAAGSAFDHSTRIRRDGRTDPCLSRREKGRGWFVFQEELLCRFGLPAGEEIEVVATK
ncbi:MAG: class I SAM-dependent methyltransferase [Deltaproteobacteria bacterium]